MLNPITGKRAYFIAYMIIWMLIAAIQMIILILIFKQDIFPAVIDSLVGNFLHGLVGIIIWFPVRFNPVSAKNYLNPVFAILITGIFTVSVWTGLSYFILSNLFKEWSNYLQFLNASVTSRIITDFLLYAVLVLIYSLMVYSMNLKEKITNEANLRTLVRESELNMLKAQINPHFLFNALNSISLLTKRSPGKAREMIIQLADYLRYSLRTGQDSNVTFDEEVENMERYLEIEKVRFGDKLIYDKNVTSGANSFPIPSMILQPLLENAIKHGVYESTKPIHIRIYGKTIENQLQLIIENNYDRDNVSKGGAGIGLKNIAARLELTYGRGDLLQIENKNGIFRVIMKIPRIQNLIN